MIDPDTVVVAVAEVVVYEDVNDRITYADVVNIGTSAHNCSVENQMGGAASMRGVVVLYRPTQNKNSQQSSV